MRRISWCLLAVLTVVLTGPPVLAQQITLEVKGDTLTVVKSFPVTISGPAGADLYFWNVPPTVTFQDEGHSIKILAAPKGSLAIGLKIISVDWTAKKLSQKFGSVAIVIGDVPPEPGPPPIPPPPIPPPPVPPPGPAPPAELLASLKAALNLDGFNLANRQACLDFAAAAKATSQKIAKEDGHTGETISTWYKNEVSAKLGPSTAPMPKILAVRKAAALWLNTNMPTDAKKVLSGTERTTMAGAFALLAAALEGTP